jgi:cellobiose phosphorylase
LVRIFGFDVAPTRFDTNFGFGSVYDPSHVHSLDSTVDATGDILGALQLDVLLGAEDSLSFTMKVAVYASGAETALAEYQRLSAPGDALTATITHLEDCLRSCEVVTPDATINEGALWSKVNMRRVMGHYPQGNAFTDDPGVSSAVVVRDCSWFVYGKDFFMPAFSRAVLEAIREKQYPNGKLPEYFDAVTGCAEDDGLNINDDTPLYVLAVHHHPRITGDPEWLEPRR